MFTFDDRNSKSKNFNITYEAHQYGNTWCQQVKLKDYLDDEAFPSPIEMLNGIKNWLIMQAKDKI